MKLFLISTVEDLSLEQLVLSLTQGESSVRNLWLYVNFYCCIRHLLRDLLFNVSAQRYECMPVKQFITVLGTTLAS